EQHARPEFEQPEIHRVDLSSAALALYSWGVADLGRFDWYEHPSAERLENATRLLTLLGALGGNPPRLTALGQATLALPVHPRLARILIAARACGRARAGAAVAAVLSEKDIRSRDTAATPGPGRSRATSGTGTSDVLDRLDQLEDAEAAGFGPSLRSRG